MTLTMLRFVFGFLFCLIVMIIRMIMSRDYRQVVRQHFCSGFWPIFHLCVAGLLNLGIPHSMVNIAQNWIPSAAVQLAKPLTPIGSVLAGLCISTGDPFTKLKALALGSAIIGVSMCAVPSFLHVQTGDDIVNVVIGYVLLVVAMALFGIAAVYIRHFSPTADVTINSLLQTGISIVACFIVSMIMDGPTTFATKFQNATLYGWVWPFLLGVVASGIAIHGFNYLVDHLGPIGTGFIPFGQIIVGVTLGVAVLGEWDGYSWWEILLNVIGIIFLASAILIGFRHEKADEHNVEEEDQKEHTEEPKKGDEDELDEL